MPDSRRSKSKLTSYGVEAAPSSHSQDQPSHWEHPATGQGGERGWGCSFDRDRLELDLRPRGLLSASPHQLLAFMGHVD